MDEGLTVRVSEESWRWGGWRLVDWQMSGEAGAWSVEGWRHAAWEMEAWGGADDGGAREVTWCNSGMCRSYVKR